MIKNHLPNKAAAPGRAFVCAVLFLAVFCALQAFCPAFAEGTGQTAAILKQPENAVVREREFATFKVETGDGRYSYKWQRRKNENARWESLPALGCKGGETNELRVYAAHPYVDGGYQYRCLVTDANGHVTETAPASLIVWSFDENAGILTFCGAGELAGSKKPWRSEGYKATEVVVFDGITKIGEDALSELGGWEKPVTVHLPGSVASIELHAFTGENLERIEVDENNPVFSDIDGVLFDKEKKTLICKPGRGSGIYEIPSGTRAIADYAFEWCAYYLEFIIPEGVEMIGDYAFRSCHGLQRLVFPEGLREIGYGTLPPVVRIPASVEWIGSNFLKNAEMFPGIREVYYCGTEEQWNKISFYNKKSDSDDYVVYYLNDASALDPAEKQDPAFDSVFDYAGRWVSGAYNEKTMRYDKEIDIRFVGDSDIVFTWRESGPNGLLRLSDCEAAVDTASGKASFDGQRFYAAKANGWLRLDGGTVTLHIDASDLDGLEDGYEFVFDTKEGDRLQSDLWFRPTA